MYKTPLWPIKILVCVTCDPFMLHTHVHALVNTHTLSHMHTCVVYIFWVCMCVYGPDVDMCLGICLCTKREHVYVCICAFTCVMKGGFTGSLHSSSGFIASGLLKCLCRVIAFFHMLTQHTTPASAMVWCEIASGLTSY